MSDREEIDQYMVLWDNAQKEFPKEKRPEPKMSSFFGMKDIVDDDFTEDEGEHWRDVYYRSLEIAAGDEEVINEEVKKPKKKKTEDKRKPKDGDDAPEVDSEKDGFGKDLAKKLGDVKFNVNPIHFSSVGNDSDVHVVPNFTDGKELRQLCKLKSILYDLESELLGTDVRGGNTKELKIKLNSLKNQVEEMSNKLIPDPKYDIS